MTKKTILITGAGGQIGSVLTKTLRDTYGANSVIATDIRSTELGDGPFELLDVLNGNRLHELVNRYRVKEIYHLAAILSARGEQNPKIAWDINMDSLFNVLDAAKERNLKVFFPSSIAAFGPNTPKVNTPQDTITQPTTVYGISKAAGENWCQYYFLKYGLDVRSVRFPGIIGYQSLPGGGTTDYAVDIYHKAILGEDFTCFLGPDTRLPMLYMDDAIQGVLQLMNAPKDKLSIRTSYNLAGVSFTPAEISAEIQKHHPDFKIHYAPDFRQAIADSWPQSIDDQQARQDWNWQPQLLNLSTPQLLNLSTPQLLNLLNHSSMYTAQTSLEQELQDLCDAGLYKSERIITSPQGAEIALNSGKEVLNFCANNYLGLSAHPEVIKAAKEAIDTHGFGMSSVRFICGTQDIHKELEQKIAQFLGMEDSILYAAAFDANGGLFEPLLGAEDAIISDELNHASIIDGIRLCKAERHRYRHNDMNDLEDKLQKSAGARRILISTDGCFSMDGTIGQLDKICDLAERYNAMVMIDECHATGFLGKTGRGTHEYRDVMGRVDIITGTLGKALGGASGGFTAARKEVVELLRQRSRPYLFSNTLAPSIAGASIKVLDLLSSSTALRDKLEANTKYFRTAMTAAGFDILPGEHPIVPIMLYDAKLAQQFAARLLEEGIYVIGFFYPVVPHGKARIRVQLSAAHELEHLEKAVAAFTSVGGELGVLK